MRTYLVTFQVEGVDVAAVTIQAIDFDNACKLGDAFAIALYSRVLSNVIITVEEQ